jgi:hypothetical protein
VHPVVIDSPNGVTVTGPAGQTTIKSLSITAGNTLDLVAGSSIATPTARHSTRARSFEVAGAFQDRSPMPARSAPVIRPGRSPSQVITSRAAGLNCSWAMTDSIN